MSIVAKQVLHNIQTVVDNGETINTEDADTLTVGIQGTSTSFKLEFWGSLDGVTYYPATGTKCNDFTISSTSTSKTGEAWDIDVNSWVDFQVRLTAIGNGNITVQANTSI